MRSNSSPPVTSSSTMKMWVLEASTSRRLTIFGWRTCFITAISRLMLAASCGDATASRLNILMA
jgi:hypothetical protein